MKRTLAVIMERRRLANRWQDEAWRPIDVAPDDGSAASRLVFNDNDSERWLHPGFAVELFRDEAEGYYLNLDSPQPFVFVKWDETAPVAVTLSYHEAARWMDGGATVEGVPMPAEWVGWLFEFVAKHYQPEPKKKRIRPDSFKGARRSDR